MIWGHSIPNDHHHYCVILWASNVGLDPTTTLHTEEQEPPPHVWNPEKVRRSWAYQTPIAVCFGSFWWRGVCGGGGVSAYIWTAAVAPLEQWEPLNNRNIRLGPGASQRSPPLGPSCRTSSKTAPCLPTPDGTSWYANKHTHTHPQSHPTPSIPGSPQKPTWLEERPTRRSWF